ncbi:porin family protein [Flavobacterium daemonense]|uniref:porin family protein n=1 Tax=Flavobacterium daemonense TaxID=1393049 RepID=UPI00118639A8|nr:porin family protein [Flavobacterium daemonense]KAF2336844.1 PorT family protein [Flavobacterium daemonense]
MKNVKKIFIGCILLTCTSGFSQSFFKNIADRLYFGVKTGANYSNFKNADFDTEGLTGFHAGAIVGYKFNDNFAVQEEFLYSTQGAKIKGGLTDGQDIKLSYVTVPILLKYKTNLGIYFEAGPQIGILIDEDFKSLGINSNTKFAQQIDGGLAAGIGYQFQNGLGIGARYYLSLTDVSKVKTAGINTNFQNNTAQVSLSYIF